MEGSREVDLLLARMNQAAEARGDGLAPQILRAEENLKLALRLRLARGPMNSEQVTAITAAPLPWSKSDGHSHDFRSLRGH